MPEDRGSSGNKKIPKAVIKRLSLYARVLNELEERNVTKISSKDLSELLGSNPAKVRKDLAYFGQFGVPGLGYYVSDLRNEIRRILRTDRVIRVVLFGVGNLGHALLSYGGFMQLGFKIVAAFDIAPEVIGKTIGGVCVESPTDLVERLRQLAPEIALLTTGSDNFQVTVDAIGQAGITAILNFIPQRLVVPPEVRVHYVNLAQELESLAYYLKD
jgi:redox-sensing transcriptional repressor